MEHLVLGARISIASAFACLVLAPAVARGHGTMIVPQSRIHLCAFGGNPENHHDPACRAAINLGGTQPIYDWNGVLQPAADGAHRAVVRDGQLCSGGNPTFRGMDLARDDWRTSPIAPDAGGRFEFVWHATAPHATREWQLYLTRDGWSPARPLAWSDVDEFCRAGAVPLVTDAAGRSVYRIPCSLPARTGRHVVFAIWQRSDSPEAFYSCSDVVFTGGVDAGWTQIGTIGRTAKIPVGTRVTFRLFDQAGADLERIEVVIGRRQGSAAVWPTVLAERVNATSAYARIGVLDAAGNVVPTTVRNGNLVYAIAGRMLRFAVDVSRPGTSPPPPPAFPVYPQGIGTYGPGTQVLGTDGNRYECRPFPNSGWCNQAPLYYAPGTGLAWAEAWLRR